MARTAALANSAKQSFFIFSPRAALAGICASCAPCGGLTTGRTAVSIGFALSKVRLTSDATGVCARPSCAFPGAPRLEFSGTGSYAPARKESADPTFAHRSRPHFFLSTWRTYKKSSTWRTKERTFKYSDVRSRCLGNMQYLAQRSTKKVLFSPH